jgi:hypothetical protein
LDVNWLVGLFTWGFADNAAWFIVKFSQFALLEPTEAIVDSGIERDRLLFVVGRFRQWEEYKLFEEYW